MTALRVSSYLLVLTTFSAAGFGVYGVSTLKRLFVDAYEQSVLPANIIVEFENAIREIPYRLSLYLAEEYPATATVNKLNQAEEKLSSTWKSYRDLGTKNSEDQQVKKYHMEISKALADLGLWLPKVKESLLSEDTSAISDYYNESWPDFQVALLNNAQSLRTRKINSIESGQNFILDFNRSLTQNLIAITIFSLVLSIVAILIQRKIKGLLNSSVRNLSTTKEDLNDSITDLQQITSNLNQQSDNQASAVQQTMASISQMSSMIKNTNDQAKKNLQMTHDVTMQVDDGNKRVGRLVASMDEISELNNDLKSIANIIDKITSKTQVITEIVFKTQLLAVNATIESSKAGQHGKGFAAVAEEVAKLADISGSAAKEINEFLNASHRKVNEFVETTSNKVKMTTEVTEAVQEIFEKISENTAVIKEETQNVTNANSEQLDGVEQVSEAINQIELVCQSMLESSSNTKRKKILDTQ